MTLWERYQRDLLISSFLAGRHPITLEMLKKQTPKLPPKKPKKKEE